MDKVRPLRTSRFWEVDVLRAVAIVMMVMVHVRYDLVYYGGHGGAFLLAHGFWRVFARTTASIFMFLVGVSLTLSRARGPQAAAPKRRPFPWLPRPIRIVRTLIDRLLPADLRESWPFLKFLVRGLEVFSLGMVITLVTWLFLGRGAVWFGILHFIGVSIILAYPFLRWRWPNLFVGAAILVVGEVLSRRTFGFSWLMWLGFQPAQIYSVDYYPLLPHFGVVLIGIFAGNMLYSGYERQFPLPDWSGLFPVQLLAFMGRHSLTIYLVHQPLIIALLTVSGVISMGIG